MHKKFVRSIHNIYSLKSAILLKLEVVLLTSTKLYITDLIFVQKKLIHVEHIIHI